MDSRGIRLKTWNCTDSTSSFLPQAEFHFFINTTLFYYPIPVKRDQNIPGMFWKCMMKHRRWF
jgi:hypothetical protein